LCQNQSVMSRRESRRTMNQPSGCAHAPSGFAAQNQSFISRRHGRRTMNQSVTPTQAVQVSHARSGPANVSHASKRPAIPRIVMRIMITLALLCILPGKTMEIVYGEETVPIPRSCTFGELYAVITTQWPMLKSQLNEENVLGVERDNGDGSPTWITWVDSTAAPVLYPFLSWGKFLELIDRNRSVYEFFPRHLWADCKICILTVSGVVEQEVGDCGLSLNNCGGCLDVLKNQIKRRIKEGGICVESLEDIKNRCGLHTGKPEGEAKEFYTD